jgi:antitoxin ParD1/3/4
LKLITLRLPERYIKELDQLVSEGRYPSRAEALRTAIRDLISTEIWTTHQSTPLSKRPCKTNLHG